MRKNYKFLKHKKSNHLYVFVPTGNRETKTIGYLMQVKIKDNKFEGVLSFKPCEYNEADYVELDKMTHVSKICWKLTICLPIFTH